MTRPEATCEVVHSEAGLAGYALSPASAQALVSPGLPPPRTERSMLWVHYSPGRFGVVMTDPVSTAAVRSWVARPRAPEPEGLRWSPTPARPCRWTGAGGPYDLPLAS